MKNLSFTSSERSAILWLSAAYTIFLIFWHLFSEEISVGIVINHAIFFFAGILVCIFLHEISHKIAAEKIGYEAQVAQFGEGIVGTILIAFYSFGRVPILSANSLELESDPRKRLDKRRKYDNPQQQAVIAAAGIVGSIIAITLMRTLGSATGSELFFTVQFGASLHAVYSLIPFELLTIIKLRVVQDMKSLTPGDGLYIIRFSHIAYTFALGFTLIFASLSLIQAPSTLILSIVLTVLVVTSMNYVLKKS